MCDACRRSGDNANLGGCAYLLQLWMWERIPVGWPKRYAHRVSTLFVNRLAVVLLGLYDLKNSRTSLYVVVTKVVPL